MSGDEGLRLHAATPRGWAAAACGDLHALLSDHAHCELKAATSAMTLLKRNPDRPGLPLRLLPLIKEETDHLHGVLRELAARGWELRRDVDSPWAAGLLRSAQATRPSGRGHLDALLVSALIELRSHERFEALAGEPALGELAGFFERLLAAEARHNELFLELAREVASEAEIAARWAELAAEEARLMDALAPGPRIHSGWAGLPR